MSVEETELLINPEMREIKQITVEDAQSAEKLFEDLMGESVAPRKEFIKKRSAEVSIYI